MTGAFSRCWRELKGSAEAASQHAIFRAIGESREHFPKRPMKFTALGVRRKGIAHEESPILRLRDRRDGSTLEKNHAFGNDLWCNVVLQNMQNH